MADAIISEVVARVAAILQEQIRNEVNLVRGAEKEVRKLSEELETIKNVLNDAEKRQFKEESIKVWLKKLECTCYEMEDILDEWNYAILKLKMERHQFDDAVVAPPKRKVCPFIPSSCLCLKKVVVRRDIAKKIISVKAQLDEILKEKDRYNFVMSQPITDPSPRSWRESTSFIDVVQVHGRDSDSEIIVTKLLANDAKREELGIQILSIVGVGGIGKTTLAQLVYNDSRIQESFGLRIWVCVSDPFDLATIAKGIIESITKGKSPSSDNLETLLQCVRDSIIGQKFLLILDDVWTENWDKWEALKKALKCGGLGSKILVTTRNERVAQVVGTLENDIHHPEQLSDEECWSILSSIAFSGRNKEECGNLHGIGRNIARKCKGLPLAAKALGSLLRFKRSPKEWENVLRSEIWQLEKAEVDLFPHLLLSYNELSPSLKRCFSYCAIFPKDYDINVEHLIGNWMALGYLGHNIGDMELKGRECFEILAMRSLFQDFEKEDVFDDNIERCKMHDIVHDFAQFLRKSGREEATEMNKTNCQSCDGSLICAVKEFRSLFWDKESPPNLCDCLTRMRVLDLRECGLQNIPRGMENLIHLRWLNLDGNDLSDEGLKMIFQLYNLQTLRLRNCRLKEIPREIGNLINLRDLDLGGNESIEELPESICDLLELQTLNVGGCSSLCGLPQGIYRLTNLKSLFNWCTHNIKQFPQGVAKLSGLRTLREFRGGSGWSNLGLLKSLNSLTGFLWLEVRLADDDVEKVVEDAREAELRKKTHIQHLTICFEDEVMEEKGSSVRLDVIDALEPHENLQILRILGYKGSKLPGWIASPLNQLRDIKLGSCNNLSSLLPLGKLPCLEEIEISSNHGLEIVGREFFGITRMDDMEIQSSSEATSVSQNIAFPKLKRLRFEGCSNWKEWEDITAEEAESAAVSFMPCLAELMIWSCDSLTALPHRLLRKASSTLEVLDITFSMQLEQSFRDKDGSAWKSLSQNNPRLRLRLRYL